MKPPPDPNLVSYEDTAKYLGVCKRRLLTEMVRLDVLPYPDDWFRWKRVDVERAREWLFAKRSERGPAPAAAAQ